MARLIVMHSYYGCESGCCGHVIHDVEAGDQDMVLPHKPFMFDHPWGKDHREWAEQIIADTYGAEHVADLDWDNSVVLED